MKNRDLLMKKFQGEHFLERTLNEIDHKWEEIKRRKGETARLKVALDDNTFPTEIKKRQHESLYHIQMTIIAQLTEEVKYLMEICSNNDYDVLIRQFREEADRKDCGVYLGE